ncbi:histone chaperone HIRA-like protein [Actinidia rufa]|uniref:Histone chaperone HIRA-like protein n=1 Tax=Actinidia rufa TaxID=165716 RepID=A0A7J0G986_9ERIC|nr:histone chaperone HIRA-like protein [Actinidia rufa]
MIAEKPSWIRHEGMQIFSIDVQPGGLRFATGGDDHKYIKSFSSWTVNVLKSDVVGAGTDMEHEICSPDLETNESTPKLLATLCDHFGSVNCVRWAKQGRHIASGFDDQVDLNWSPEDSLLASGSDNTVHIWNMSNSIFTAVLRGHFSLVKVVTWDLVGSFIASQSDDYLANERLEPSSQDRWRLESPCGHFITTTHGFQKPRHSAPVLERGERSAIFDFLGHNGPVIVVKFNHSMFRFSSTQVVKDAPVGSPDGYSLFASSLDGTVATFHFEVKELGQRLTDAESDELRSDGRKRIIPEAVGLAVWRENISGDAQYQAIDFSLKSSNHRKDDNGLVLTDGGIRECSDMKERSCVTARANISALEIEKVPASASGDGSISVEQTGSAKALGYFAKAFGSLASSGTLSIRVCDKKEGEDTIPVCLEARPREHSMSDIVGAVKTYKMKETEISCTRGDQTLWSDRVSVNITVLDGNANFWAVGCEDGCLQVSMEFLTVTI